jgi:hypothetical protein
MRTSSILVLPTSPPLSRSASPQERPTFHWVEAHHRPRHSVAGEPAREPHADGSLACLPLLIVEGGIEIPPVVALEAQDAADAAGPKLPRILLDADLLEVGLVLLEPGVVEDRGEEGPEPEVL